MLFKDYRMNSAPHLSIQVAEGLHRGSSLPLLAAVFAAYPRRPAGLSRRAVALVRDGGAYPGYRDAHRSAGPAVRTQTC